MQPQPPPPAVMFQLIASKFVSRPLYVAAQLRLADHLAGGAQSVLDLAALTETHADSLYRMLRALASVGVFCELEGRRFAQTPTSELLLDQPGSLRAMALWLGDPRHDLAWHDLLGSIRTGEPALDRVFGKPVWEFLAAEPDLAEIFNHAMTSLATVTHRAVAATYDFSGLTHLVDVGGGHGGLLTTILADRPHLSGVVFDLPQVVEGATAMIAARGLEARCRTEAGSFFEAVPAGGDGYLLSSVLHDWSDGDAVRILTNIRRAIAPEGRLIVSEGLVGEPNEPGLMKLLDLEMLVMTPGGRERSAAEFAALFAASGFELARVLPTDGPGKVLEGLPRRVHL